MLDRAENLQRTYRELCRSPAEKTVIILYPPCIIWGRRMNLKLKTGVKVSVQDGEKSNLLVFDKPVRIVELTREESIKLGVSLAKGGRTGVTAELRSLIKSGFFSEPKTLSDLKMKLFHEGIQINSASLNSLIVKMVRRGELKRTGQRGSYGYQEPHQADRG